MDKKYHVFEVEALVLRGIAFGIVRKCAENEFMPVVGIGEVAL